MPDRMWKPTGEIAWIETPLRTPVCVQLANGKWCQLMHEFRDTDGTREWRAIGIYDPSYAKPSGD